MAKATRLVEMYVRKKEETFGQNTNEVTAHQQTESYYRSSTDSIACLVMQLLMLQ